MIRHSIHLDLDTALASPGSCPTCLDRELRPAPGAQGLVFVCPGCTRAWVYELGTLRRWRGLGPSSRGRAAR